MPSVKPLRTPAHGPSKIALALLAVTSALIFVSGISSDSISDRRSVCSCWVNACDAVPVNVPLLWP